MKMFVYRIKIENKILEMMLILVIHPAGDFFLIYLIWGVFFSSILKESSGMK